MAIVTGAGCASHCRVRCPIAVRGPPWATRVSRRRARCSSRSSRTHSGQCTPTGACCWHSPQMVRPQRWQSTQLCRSGCR
ncbi:hypothetical protein D8Y24_10920 [Agrococcus lahaulensis]|nr:hypothetical protein D8Y24_10920 [Agrococcus lahaulensis]